MRVEYFELRTDSAGPAIGTARLLRSDSAAGSELEWQIRFAGDGFEAWQVESRSASGRRCLWRERAERRSRTLVAEEVGGSLELTEWGMPSVFREVVPSEGPIFFPLELSERLRTATLEAKQIALFDPLSNSVIPVTVQDGGREQDTGSGLRQVDLARADGTLAGSWTFLGKELVSFRWQRGGLTAVRVQQPDVVVPAEFAAPATPSER